MKKRRHILISVFIFALLLSSCAKSEDDPFEGITLGMTRDEVVQVLKMKDYPEPVIDIYEEIQTAQNNPMAKSTGNNLASIILYEAESEQDIFKEIDGVPIQGVEYYFNENERLCIAVYGYTANWESEEQKQQAVNNAKQHYDIIVSKLTKRFGTPTSISDVTLHQAETGKKAVWNLTKEQSVYCINQGNGIFTVTYLIEK